MLTIDQEAREYFLRELGEAKAVRAGLSWPRSATGGIAHWFGRASGE